MYFTLAISAATRQVCAALVSAAGSTDPRVMPMPGPPVVVWRAPDERSAMLCWGTQARPAPRPRSHAETIWAEADALRARTGVARVDPVYVAEVPGAVVVSDRACWAAAVTGRLGEHDPAMIGAFLAIGYPFGAATAFRKVRALGCDQMLTVTGDRLVVATARDSDAGSAGPGEGRADRSGVASADRGAAVGADRYAAVAAALVETALAETALAETALAGAVDPPRAADGLVELSLTGGKDSRLIAAALTAAKVPFRARTHGFASHPDVVVAAMIAARLGVEHVVTEPKPPGAGQAPDEAALLGRLRSAVLVSDGMLSAYENIGTPDPHFATEPVQAGGHGGELLRGGYAVAAWHDRRSPGQARAWSEARGIELFRRMTTRRLGLLRRTAAGEYLASLTPYAVALPRGPLRALDHFYLVNRAGRWSATARQAYLMRSPLMQPFFSDHVIRAACAVPLPDRITDRLHREVLAVLCPDLLELPLAGGGWKSGPRNALGARPAGGPRPAASPDWRRHYGQEMARFLRDYTLDLGDMSPMFDIVRRQAAERVLRPPHTDPDAVWALATLAALLSGDWLKAREPKGQPSARVPGRDNAGRITR